LYHAFNSSEGNIPQGSKRVVVELLREVGNIQMTLQHVLQPIPPETIQKSLEANTSTSSASGA
jgi:hypothetical protein